MGINEVGNIIYLKDFLPAESKGKNPVERKSSNSGENSAAKAERKTAQSAAVEEQNRLASSPSIRDFEEALKVMERLKTMVQEQGEATVAAHSAKPVDPSSI